MIVRIEKTKNYSVMANYALVDPKLSLKAKGLWAFIMSKPDKWNFSSRALATELKEGKDSILAAMKELELAGYLQRGEVIKNSEGQFTQGENVLHEKPWAAFPSTENPATYKVLNKINTNTPYRAAEAANAPKEKENHSNSLDFGANSGNNTPPLDKKENPCFKLLWDVVRMYGLPVINANHIRKWAKDLEKMSDGVEYLEKLLDKDLRKIEGEFKPTLNTAFDVLQKKLKIQRFYNGGEDKSYDPRVFE